MPANMLMEVPYIKKDGADIDPAWMGDLEEVVFELALGAPDMATLRFADPRLARLKDNLFSLGDKLEISFDVGAGRVSVGTIEVASIEPEIDAGAQSKLVIRGYNKMARLHFQQKTRSFLKQTDSQIASTIAQECGLTAKVVATSAQFEYLVQWNQTDMEFLMERADRIGYQVYVEGDDLYFQPAGTVRTGAETTLTYAEHLISFRPRVTPVRQATQVQLRAWDQQSKSAVTATASSADNDNRGGYGKTGAQALRAAYSVGADMSIFDVAVLDATEATKVAQAALDQLNREFVEAEGVAVLSPTIKAGRTVYIDSLPGTVGGTYFVTSVRHIWTASGGLTEFTISGRTLPTVSGLLDGRAAPQHIYGVWPAIVTNQGDPNNQGRVKVKFPMMPLADGVELESTWARIASPMAGSARGLLILPEVGDEVLVAFGGGDPNYPFIVGTLWNGQDKPPLANNVAVADGKVEQRIFKTRAGHTITFFDKTGEEKIRIEDKAQQFIEFDAANKKITISGKGDMDILCEQNLKIEAKGKIDMLSTQDMTLKSSAKGTFETTADLTLKASTNVNIEASASLSAKATGTATLEGTGGVTVKSPGNASLEGSAASVKGNVSVSLGGGATAELKAGIVRIN